MNCSPRLPARRAAAVLLCAALVWTAAALPVQAAPASPQQDNKATRDAAKAPGDHSPSPAERMQQELIKVIADVTPTVISVFRIDPKTGDLSPGSGSGVIISADGYALSNFHVTEAFKELRAGLPGGKIYKARLCGLDRTGDIALIKIESDKPLPFAKLGSSGDLQVGEAVIAMGNPFMLATDFNPTVSLGIVSGLHRYLPGGGVMHKDLIYADAIQIDAALNPGNSGGPLFNSRGELMGINGRIAPRHIQGMQMQKLNAGIGFAVPIDGIKLFLDDLKAGHEVDRGYLGVGKVEVVDEGLRVEKVTPDSPAEIYGIKEGDILLRLDGTPISGPGQMENLVQLHPAGTRIKVELRRGQETLTETVQLAGIQTAALLKFAEYRLSRTHRTDDTPAAKSADKKPTVSPKPVEKAPANAPKPAAEKKAVDEKKSANEKPPVEKPQVEKKPSPDKATPADESDDEEDDQ